MTRRRILFRKIKKIRVLIISLMRAALLSITISIRLLSKRILTIRNKVKSEERERNLINI